MSFRVIFIGMKKINTRIRILRSIILSSSISIENFLRICNCTCNVNHRVMNNLIRIMAPPQLVALLCLTPPIIHVAGAVAVAEALSEANISWSIVIIINEQRGRLMS